MTYPPMYPKWKISSLIHSTIWKLLIYSTLNHTPNHMAGVHCHLTLKMLVRQRSRSTRQSTRGFLRLNVGLFGSRDQKCMKKTWNQKEAKNKLNGFKIRLTRWISKDIRSLEVKNKIQKLNLWMIKVNSKKISLIIVYRIIMRDLI